VDGLTLAEDRQAISHRVCGWHCCVPAGRSMFLGAKPLNSIVARRSAMEDLA